VLCDCHYALAGLVVGEALAVVDRTMTESHWNLRLLRDFRDRIEACESILDHQHDDEEAKDEALAIANAIRRLIDLAKEWD
jgi:hypothetical protein